MTVKMGSSRSWPYGGDIKQIVCQVAELAQEYFQILGHLLCCIKGVLDEHVPGHTEDQAGDVDVGDVFLCLAAAVRKLANPFLIFGPMATQG